MAGWLEVVVWLEVVGAKCTLASLQNAFGALPPTVTSTNRPRSPAVCGAGVGGSATWGEAASAAAGGAAASSAAATGAATGGAVTSEAAASVGAAGAAASEASIAESRSWTVGKASVWERRPIDDSRKDASRKEDVSSRLGMPKL